MTFHSKLLTSAFVALSLTAKSQLFIGPVIGAGFCPIEKFAVFNLGANAEIAAMNQRAVGGTIFYGLSGEQNAATVFNNARNFMYYGGDFQYAGKLKMKEISIAAYYKILFGDNEGDDGFHLQFNMGFQMLKFDINYSRWIVDGYGDKYAEDTYLEKATSFRFLCGLGFGYDKPTDFGSVFFDFQTYITPFESEIRHLPAKYYGYASVQIGIRKRFSIFE